VSQKPYLQLLQLLYLLLAYHCNGCPMVLLLAQVLLLTVRQLN
jgi:hypothetical protein